MIFILISTTQIFHRIEKDGENNGESGTRKLEQDSRACLYKKYAWNSHEKIWKQHQSMPMNDTITAQLSIATAKGQPEPLCSGWTLNAHPSIGVTMLIQALAFGCCSWEYPAPYPILQPLILVLVPAWLVLVPIRSIDIFGPRLAAPPRAWLAWHCPRFLL